MMNNQEIYDLYVAQSENVRELWRAKVNLVKDINFYIRKGDEYQVKIKTKFLALLYSAWSEAQFVQIVYTPNGFSSSEIKGILHYKKKNGIGQAWKRLLENSKRKVGNISSKGDLNNRLRKLLEVIKDYIVEPSELRNKLAHGEWINALNGKLTAAHNEKSKINKKLKALDPVYIEKSFEIHRFLGFIVRDLVQSLCLLR